MIVARLHVAITVPVPVGESAGIGNDQVTTRASPTVCCSSTAATPRNAPGAVYVNPHTAPGAARTLTEAFRPGTAPCTLVNRTSAGTGVAAGAAGGRALHPTVGLAPGGPVHDGAGCAGASGGGAGASDGGGVSACAGGACYCAIGATSATRAALVTDAFGLSNSAVPFVPPSS